LAFTGSGPGIIEEESMYPETAYAIARIAEIKHEISQPMSRRSGEHRLLTDARRARWNTFVHGIGRHIVGHRRRGTRVAAVAEA
jgi:hypothetical protein